MNLPLQSACRTVATEGERLRGQYRFDWSAAAQQSASVLRLHAETDNLPPTVALVGGASSGKSTVFNNLLGGRNLSRITAKGHATLGPILAVHEDQREAVAKWLSRGLLLPGFEVDQAGDGGGPVQGAPSSLAVCYHLESSLRDVLLLDTPDFTSEAARLEGDVLLALLPWFDRVIVVIDHERWFDRQSISHLRAHSNAFGQQRFALFNATQEEKLTEADKEALNKQAARVEAVGHQLLDYRRGRGLCVFPPGTFDEVVSFARGPAVDRNDALVRVAAEAANRVLNQNEERIARLDQLRDKLQAAARRVLPATDDCMTSLMTADERSQMDVVSRVFRLRRSKSWLSAQTRRIEGALKRVPLVGSFVRQRAPLLDDQDVDPNDRRAIGLAFFESIAKRQAHELQRAVHRSQFWDEISRWTDLAPGDIEFAWTEELRDAVRQDIAHFDEALGAWNERVKAECRGLAPNIGGAVSAGVLGVAIALVAVQGPIAALTLVAAKGALAAAAGKLAAGAGAGALFGKQLGRLVQVVREKLIGSEEFRNVRRAADAVLRRCEESGDAMTSRAVEEARRLVLPGEDALSEALQILRQAWEHAS